jgi:hypothetical protein
MKPERLACLIFHIHILNLLKIPQTKHCYVILEQTAVRYRARNFLDLKDFIGEI